MSFEEPLEDWLSIDGNHSGGTYEAPFGSVVIPETIHEDLEVHVDPAEYGKDFDDVENMEIDDVIIGFPWGRLLREDDPGQLIRLAIHQAAKKVDQFLTLNAHTVEDRYPQWKATPTFQWDTDHDKVVLKGRPSWQNGPVKCEVGRNESWSIEWIGDSPAETLHIWAENDHFEYESLDEAVVTAEQTIRTAIGKYEGIVENPEEVLPLGAWESAVLSFPSAGLYPRTGDGEENPEILGTAAKLILQELREFEFVNPEQS